jgi:hypothetical protein
MSMSKGPLEKRERLRRLCKRIIAGDGGTRAELQSATMKYVHTQYDDPTQVLKRLYRDEGELGSLLRKAVEIVGEAAGDDDRGDNGGGGGATDHHVSRLADLLVESSRFTDRGHALRHLTSHPDGVALVRTHKAVKDKPMDRIEALTNALTGSGLQKFCKALIDNDSQGVSEHELTEAATRYAKGLYPDLSGPAAFSRLYESDVTLRKAVQVAKAWPSPMSLEPMVATGASGFPSTRMRSGSSPGRGDDSGDADSVGVSDAYEQLVKLAEQQRRAGETASQAFERVFTDPVNKELAARAHRRPTAPAGGVYAWPR